ncbi:MAG TPA: YkvA family protein [Polyangiaceae bacterium]
MTELETRCLDAFPLWIRSLAEDATQLAQLLSTDSLPQEARRLVAGGLNYVFKSLDLVPDGLESLGFLDDAFVLRVGSRLALAVPQAKEADMRGVLSRLSRDAPLVAELLGDDHARLERYVRDLTQGAARGRSVSEIVEDPSVRSAFVSDVHAWAKSYTAPAFTRDEKNLVKLKSFLGAKLPS